MLKIRDVSDREVLEMGEARVLVHGFISNGQSKEWLAKAMRHSKRIYGNGSEERIRGFMKIIWRNERISAQTAGEGVVA